MSFVLINAVFWPLLLLGSVPILLHLFARSRPPVYRFSSIELIRRIMRLTMRVKKPQDLLLLILRTVLTLALILLFLRPLFFAQKRLAGFMQRKNVVIVIDATASMGWNEGAQTRFAAACAEASEVLAGLSAGDSANIVWLTSAPQAVFPSMGSNFQYLQTRLRQARLTDEAGDIASAVRLAAELLEDQEGQREICLISDFQTTAWKDIVLGIPDNIDLVKLKVGRGRTANVAVTDVFTLPGRPLVDEEISIHCRLHNYSDKAVRKSVYLQVGEGRHAQELQLPAWSSATAVFRHRFPQPGTAVLTAGIGEDEFPADDRRWAAITVLDQMHVGMLPAATPTAAAWRRALAALPWTRLQELSLHEIQQTQELDVILLPHWDGAGQDLLRPCLAGGRTVICEPAQGLSLAALAVLLGRDRRTATAAAEWEQPRQPLRLKLGAERDELFAVFADGEYGDPTRGRYRGRFKLARDSLPQGETLLHYEDGVPALCRFRDTGTLFLWNLSLDPEYSSLQKRSEYLALFGEALLTGRSSSSVYQRHDFRPGEPLTFSHSADILSADLVLQDEAGRKLPVRREALGRFQAAELPPPGVYIWRHKGKAVEYSTINFPQLESDLRSLSLAELKQPGVIAVAGGGQIRDLRDGIKLWPWLLGFAVLAALGEGLVLIWAERT